VITHPFEDIVIIASVCVICNLFFGYLRGGVKTVWMKIFYIHLSVPIIYYLRHKIYNVDFVWVPVFLFLSLGTQKIVIEIRKKIKGRTDV
jgi:hypothetical protein